MIDPWRLDAVNALHLIRGGELTAEALLRSCLERIADREPLIQAFAHLDPEAALCQSALQDRLAERMPLAGLSVGIKDIIDTADMPTAYGSRRYAGHRPAQDAACVEVLRAQGAVIPGKTATTEFAGTHPAETRNPRNLEFSPGGSSSGSVAAVADGMLPLAIGTQTAGSVIRPAAFCGIVGIKPSFGRIAVRGVRPAAGTFDTVGTFGRTVADAALALACLVGDPALTVDGSLAARPRIGLCRTPAWDKASDDTQAALEAAASRVSEAGADVREVRLPTLFDRVIEAQSTVMSAETGRSSAADLAAGEDGLGRETIEAARAGAEVTGAQESAARLVLRQAQAAFAEVMEEFDVLLAPSAADEAPRGLGWTGDPVFNRLWTAVGAPCLTLPFTAGRQGLPIGAQLIGAAGADKRMLDAAVWVEAVFGRRGSLEERP